MAALLEAVDLSKRFLKDEKYLIALEDFSLKVDEGDFVVILGRSGCGKSTFLNIAAGLMVPSSGHVLYRGNRNVGPTL